MIEPNREKENKTKQKVISMHKIDYRTKAQHKYFIYPRSNFV